MKGKDKPIGIYEPVALEQEITDAELSELQKSEQAISAYRNQDWEHARLLLQELLEVSPERKLYSIYLERIDDFMKNPPPPDWDGVFVHTTK